MLSLEYLKELNQDSTEKNYITNWNKDLHKLTNNVVKVTENNVTKLNPKDHLIKEHLVLFPWQEAYVNILENFEQDRYIITELPYANGPKQSTLYSDVCIISSKLGSGKTYSIFAHIAKNPIPPKKTYKIGEKTIEGWKLIKGYAPIYNLMFKTGNEKQYMSRSPNDLKKINCTSFIPAYFNNVDYQPSMLFSEYYTDILKFNIIICKEALVEQMESYLKRDFNIPFAVINNLQRLINFIIRLLLTDGEFGINGGFNPLVIILGTFLVQKTEFINDTVKKIANYVNNRNETIEELTKLIEKLENENENVLKPSIKNGIKMLNEPDEYLKNNPKVNLQIYKNTVSKQIQACKAKLKNNEQLLYEYKIDLGLYKTESNKNGIMILDTFAKTIQDDINYMDRNIDFNSVDVLYLAQVKTTQITNAFKPFARIFYDDYDQLNFSSTVFIPAVNSYYVSATRGVRETPYIHSIPSFNSILYALTNICVEIPKDNLIIGLTDEPIYITHKCINPYKITYIHQLLQILMNYEKEVINRKYITSNDTTKKKEELKKNKLEIQLLEKVVLSDSIDDIIGFIDEIIFGNYVKLEVIKEITDKNKKLNYYIDLILNNMYQKNKIALVSNSVKKQLFTKNIHELNDFFDNISNWLIVNNTSNTDSMIENKIKNIINIEESVLKEDHFSRIEEKGLYKKALLGIDVKGLRNESVQTLIWSLLELEKNAINNNHVWDKNNNPFKSYNNISDLITSINKLECFEIFVLHAPFFTLSYYMFLQNFYPVILTNSLKNLPKLSLGRNPSSEMLTYKYTISENDNKNYKCDVCRRNEKTKYITKCCYNILCEQCVVNVFSKKGIKDYNCNYCLNKFNENDIGLEILPHQNPILVSNSDLFKKYDLTVNVSIVDTDDKRSAVTMLFSDSLNYYSPGISLKKYSDNYQTILGKLTTTMVDNIEQKDSKIELYDKNTTLIKFYQQQKYNFEIEHKQKKIKILVYGAYAGIYESFLNYIKNKNINLDVPVLNNINDLEAFKINTEQEIAFIVSNELYSGVNSEWCDILVLYQKFDTAEVTEQIIARGQRTGRKRRLIVFTLKYDSETYQLEQIMNAIQ
jgi:hypothetical protein